jgi:hypothetical protein
MNVTEAQVDAQAAEWISAGLLSTPEAADTAALPQAQGEPATYDPVTGILTRADGASTSVAPEQGRERAARVKILYGESTPPVSVMKANGVTFGDLRERVRWARNAERDVNEQVRRLTHRQPAPCAATATRRREAPRPVRRESRRHARVAQHRAATSGTRGSPASADGSQSENDPPPPGLLRLTSGTWRYQRADGSLGEFEATP